MTFLAGFGLGLSLIVAIGAQNVFVLRQGLRRDHVLLVVAICAASDAALIAIGVSGIGLAVAAAPWLVTAARLAGAGFLVAYGALAARRAWRASDVGFGEGADLMSSARGGTATRVALTCVALTWLLSLIHI